MRNILFLCTGNSCRSQMAEGFARVGGRAGQREDLRVWSAGTEPTGIHPRAHRVMAEVGVDLSAQRSKPLSEVPIAELDLVVTLCSEAAGCCPAFPPQVKRLDWHLPDPAGASGPEEDVMRVFREVRDDIRDRVEALLGEGGPQRH